MINQVVTRQFFYFSIVGTVGFVVDSSVLYAVVYWVGLNHYSGRLLSYICAVTVTWYLNRNFTFKSRSEKLFKEWIKFAYTNLLGAFVNVGSYSLLVLLSPIVYKHPLIGVATGSVLGLAVNFIASKKFVFRND